MIPAFVKITPINRRLAVVPYAQHDRAIPAYRRAMPAHRRRWWAKRFLQHIKRERRAAWAMLTLPTRREQREVVGDYGKVRK